MPADKFLVELRRFIAQDAGHDFNACFSQCVKSLSRHQRIGIINRSDHTPDAGVDQRLSARRRLSVMSMWFERDICRAAYGPFARLS